MSLKINERLGVPDFIPSLTNHIYNAILGNLEYEDDIYLIDPISGDVTLSTDIYLDEPNIPFVTIIISFDIKFFKARNSVDINKRIISGGGYINSKNVKKVDIILDFQFEESVLSGNRGNPDFLYPILLECIKNNKHTVTKILSHELKHAYDFHKNKFLGKHIDNDINAVIKNLMINEITVRTFLYNIYYSLCFENLTRPTEIYTELKNKKVSKNTFIEKLKKSDMYENLKYMKNFDKNVFLSSINMNDSEIKKIIEHTKIENTPKALINLILENMLNSIIEGTLFKKYGQDLIFISLFNNEMLKPDVEKLKRKFKMLKNIDIFLDFIEKRFKFVGNNTLRKISKIWDLFKNNETPSNIMSKINKKVETVEKNENMSGEHKTNLILPKALKYIIEFNIENWTINKNYNIPKGNNDIIN